MKTHSTHQKISNNKTLKIKPLFWVLTLLFAHGFATSTVAAPLDLTQKPMGNAKGQPAPNVIISVDDSGSMFAQDVPGSPGKSRMDVLKETLTNTFTEANIPDNRIRMTWQGLQACSTGLNKANCPKSNGQASSNLFRSFDATHRAKFMDWVNGLDAVTMTPLHRQMQNVTNYIGTTDVNGFWAYKPGETQLPLLECRRAYHVLMTDGGWNSQNGQKTPNGNEDGTAKTLPDGTAYSPTSNQTQAYADTYGTNALSTLADFAFYHWSNDWSTMPNTVQPVIKEAGPTTVGGVTLQEYWNPKNDPATWQHLQTYTIGFGNGATNWAGAPDWNTNTYDGDYPNLVNNTKEWQNVIAGNARESELWHSALNGRGKFIPATTAADLTNAFKDILNKVMEDTSKPIVSVASKTTYLRNDSNIYLAGYDAKGWTGNLVARTISAAGAVGITNVWSAAEKLTDAGFNVSTRLALTHDGANGIPFAPGWLNSQQMADLSENTGDLNLANDRISYLRGDRSKEVSNGGTFRNRGSRLGDIVNSNLWLVSKPLGPYSSTTYQAFKTGHANRTPMLYVGANDGFLHGFDANTGDEKIAYMPKGLIKPSVSLTKVDYEHRYFVDGHPYSGDADVGGWKTFLVGGLGGGGKGYFILNVTNPSNFSETNASNIVVSDMTDSNDSDIGHVYAPAVTDSYYTTNSVQITKMNNGKWAAVMGNGYNSTNEDAVLVIHYLDGSGIKKISTNTAGANGLSAPQLIDVNGDGTADMAYAGDLKGNLWKFNLTGGEAAWKVAFTGQPLFTAKDANGVIQPITAAPTWLPHPLGGVMLAFGTGRNIAVGDSGDVQKQTIYGIYDNSAVSLSANKTVVTITDSSKITGRTQLVQQTVTGGSGDFATTSNNPVPYSGNNAKRGWYFDLPISGERVLANANILDASLFYVFSQIPATTEESFESCAGPSSGIGYVNILSIYSGTASPASIFAGTQTSYSRKRIEGTDGIVLNQPGNKGVMITDGGNTGVSSTDFQFPDDEGANIGWREVK